MRVVFIAAIILALLTGYWLHNLLSSKAVHKTMDKKTEKVLMNPNPSMRFYDYIVQDSSNSVTISNSPIELRAYYKGNEVHVEYSNDFVNWKTLVVFQQEPIHDTIYKIKKVYINNSADFDNGNDWDFNTECDTCPKIEIPLIDKH